MIQIHLCTIPHHEQRYNTVGDWRYTNTTGVLFIYVSDLNDWRYELLIAIHELIEALLCSHQGITQEVVDRFDLHYPGDYDEPGDDPRCPYSGPHCIATGVERILAAVMGISWTRYEETIDNLPQWKGKNDNSTSTTG